VFAVLKGEVSASEAARRHGVSEQSVHNWKSQFLDGGRAALVAGKLRPSSRESQLEDELEATKAALGEAHVELRVLKRVAEALPPSRSSK
jgi:transposase